MPAGKATVYVVHPSAEVARLIADLLRDDTEISVVGAAQSVEVATSDVTLKAPAIILVACEWEGVDTAQLMRELLELSPSTGAIALMNRAEPSELRRFLQSGARSFVVMPFDREQLSKSITDVYEKLTGMRQAYAAKRAAERLEGKGRTIAVFGPKGGIGTTMVAANLAVSMAKKAKGRMVLVDGNFSMGDLHLYLNVKPQHTILDFLSSGVEADSETLQSVVQRDVIPGLDFLARPQRPEMAEMVTADGYRRVLSMLVDMYWRVIVDCQSAYDERTLSALDKADVVITLVTPEVGALVNASDFLNLAEALGYPEEKIIIVLNRSDSQVGLTNRDVEHSLNRRINWSIPSRGREMAKTLNLGVPIVTAQPHSDVSKVLTAIANDLSD